MAQSQTEIQTLLEGVLGTRNVYFQPPEAQNLKYPCIVYILDTIRSDFADGNPYKIHERYQVTHISRNLNSEVTDKLIQLPMSRFTSFFVRDGLNHHNYAIYF